MIRILIIEDDESIAELLSQDLELEGYHVTVAKDGVEGLAQARALKPDLIILDITLPKMNGYDVCRSLRRDASDVLIVMLTARGRQPEKVIGLDLGADDYVTKPYDSMELIARLRALLRRHNRELEKLDRFSFGDITLSFSRMEAAKDGHPFALTKKEFQMLELLIRNRGRVVSRDEFLREIWGYDVLPSTRTVDNHIMALRRKLSPDNLEAFIISVHGSGYKFVV